MCMIREIQRELQQLLASSFSLRTYSKSQTSHEDLCILYLEILQGVKSEVMLCRCVVSAISKSYTVSRNFREEENTFIVQLDILRGIHADLASLSDEVSHLLGFQILVHLVTCVIFVVMFGYFFAASMMVDQFYWPYLVLCLLPAVRIFLIGHWGQCLEQQVCLFYGLAFLDPF